MSKSPTAVIQEAYGAFGRGDVPALLALMTDDVEWKFIGSPGMPYNTTAHGKEQVAQWFASIPTVETVLEFVPREFFEGPEHVTVLGWERTRAIPSEREFASEWVHVFVVKNGLVQRFWGTYDTAASAAAR